MSGFDDLLQQSSRALEENPFEDPFAHPRPRSPDPWSSYTHQTAAIGSPAFKYDTSGFGGESATTQAVEVHDDSLGPSTLESPALAALTTSSDPLDSANLPPDDEPDYTTGSKASPRYSSFRESIGTEPPARPSQPSAISGESVPESGPPRAPSPALPSITSPQATSPPVQLSSPVTPSSAVPPELEGHTSPPSPSPPSSARLPQRQAPPHPSVHVPSSSSSPTASDSHRAISSPLDQPPVTPFASLALGGESFNGWDGAQSTFVNNASFPSSAQEEEEDDDDDKPLRPRPVRTPFYCFVDAIHGCSRLRHRPRTKRKPGYSPCSRLASRIHRKLATLSVRSPCTRFTQRHVLSEFVSVSISRLRFPDDFSDVFQALIFCSSPLFRLPLVV
jgi:sorting nexin-1/2